MTDQQKLEKIMNLLTDQNVGKLCKKGQLQGRDEEFGALVAISATFKEAYKIYKAK